MEIILEVVVIVLIAYVGYPLYLNPPQIIAGRPGTIRFRTVQIILAVVGTVVIIGICAAILSQVSPSRR